MFRETSELSLTRQPAGMLPGWVRWVITAACLVSFVSIGLGSQLLWAQLPRWVDLGYFRHALTFFISFWILVSFFPPWPMSRAMRVAVLLPLAHAVVILCAWPVWTSVSRFVRDTDATTTLATQFPLVPAVAIGALFCAGVAGLLAKRRSGEWIHGFTVLALAELLLLGLWMPIAVSAWPGGFGEWWSPTEPLLADAGSRIVFTVLPPTVLAIGFTTVALRRPAWLTTGRGAITGVLGMLMFVAFTTRATASGRVMLLYSNFLPVLLAAALVVIVALCVLGVVTWWRGFRTYRTFVARERRGGTIAVTAEDGDEPVIGLEITSWLRGPRVVQRQFTVATSAGAVPVRGAHLIAPMPAATTQLHVGEALAVLAPGQDVQLAGVDEAGGDPFRTSAAPVADAVFVAPAALERPGFSSVALAMWRPCIAYLLIVSAVAVPALAALLATD